jgi:hypothetical protein
MKFPRYALSRRSFAAAVFGALVLAACQTTGFGTNPSAAGDLAGALKERSLSPASMLVQGHQYAYWQTYNAGYGANTIITGISDNGGNYGGKMYLAGVGYANTSLYKSFSATMLNTTNSPTPGGPTPEPPGHNPPDVYLTQPGSNPSGININFVGYLSPSQSSALCARSSAVTCGFIYNPRPTTKSGPTEFYPQDPNEGTSEPCGGTFLTGTEGANIQVGYYLKPTGSGGCAAHAIEEYSYQTGNPTGPQWIEFDLSSLVTTTSGLGTITNSWAYGISDEGFVVGAFTVSGFGPHYYIGWKFKAFKYTALQYGNNTTEVSSSYFSTVPKMIGFDSTVVGSYTDSNGKLNGFQDYQGWHPENYSNDTSEATETIVNGYNDPGDMVGTYRVSGGAWKGFIAQCTGNC